MKRAIFALLTLCAGLTALPAAMTVTLKDGDAVVAESVAAEGTKIRINQAGNQSRVVEVTAIDRIDMPEPPALAETYAVYASGDVLKTLTTMGKLKVELDPFRNITGAREWWLEAEFLRGHILLGQKRYKDIEPSMKELAADAADPTTQQHAKVFLAHLAGLNGDPRKALGDLKEIIAASTDPETLADAWLFAGANHAAVNEPLNAVLAYLRVPVFYPDHALPLAAARLGAARSFVALEKPTEARRVLKDLVAQQGSTPEGAEGKKLLAQVERDLNIAAEPTKEESNGK